MSRLRLGPLTFLLPVLICLPCLAAPLLALSGAAALSAVVSAPTTALWLIAAAVLTGGGAVVVLLLRRRHAARCCPSDVTIPSLPAEATR